MSAALEEIRRRAEARGVVSFPPGERPPVDQAALLEDAMRRIRALERQADRLEGEIRTLEDPTPMEDAGGGTSGGSFSGRVWLNGKLWTGLKSIPSAPWVIVWLDNRAVPVEEYNGAIPDPLPHNAEYFLKANTYGDIHVIGTR